MTTMTQTEKVLYTAKLHTTGGREGASHSSDGRLDVKLAIPGGPGVGTNPEQLFAAGWSACFESAILHVARDKKISIPPNAAVDAEVDLILSDGGYSIAARLKVSLPGLPREVAQGLVDAADQTCPYSKATRGNIPVSVTLV